MSAPVRPPQQYTQPSRKGKKAWRKNVDISQITSGLEDLRDEILTGGPVAEKPSEELFAVDTQGDIAIRKRYEKLYKPLKADEILAQRSAAPAVDSRKRPASSLGDGMVPEKRRKGNWVSRKEVQRLRQVAAEGNRDVMGRYAKDDEPGMDLWAEKAPSEEEDSKKFDHLPKSKPKVAPPTIQKPPISMTASGNPVPSLQKPKAGTSYNPSFNDWDDLLTAEDEREIEAEKKRLEELKAKEDKEARVAAAAKWQAEASDDGTDWEGIASERENAEMVQQKRPKRKTPAEKNRTKRRRETERQARHEGKMANRKKQADDILKAALQSQENVIAPIDEPLPESVHEKEGDDTAIRRRRFGNTT